MTSPTWTRVEYDENSHSTPETTPPDGAHVVRFIRMDTVGDHSEHVIVGKVRHHSCMDDGCGCGRTDVASMTDADRLGATSLTVYGLELPTGGGDWWVEVPE